MHQILHLGADLPPLQILGIWTVSDAAVPLGHCERNSAEVLLMFGLGNGEDVFRSVLWVESCRPCDIITAGGGETQDGSILPRAGFLLPVLCKINIVYNYKVI